MIEHFQLKLTESFMLAPTVRHLAFERADGAPFAFAPGQFIQVHFHYDDGKPTKRSYSVGTPADAGKVQRMELAVSYVDGGAATRLFERLQTGEEIEASGPYGRFCLMDDDANQRYLLIATGTGVAPYRSMLPQIEKLIAEKSRRFVLLYGARTEQELLYGEEFEAFAQRHPGAFVFHPCFSRGGRATPRPHDRQGHVQDALPEIEPHPEHDIAYLCGNPDMVDATFTQLKELGLPIKHIRREKYVSSR